MPVQEIKQKWDRLWEEGVIHFYPEENKALSIEDEYFPLFVEYAPERAKRFMGEKNEHLPLGAEIWKRNDMLFEFDNLVMLANNRPVSRYHSILCSREHHPQNDLSLKEIQEVSALAERYGFRSFLNLLGTAATLNHFHTQVLFEPFHLEELPCAVHGNVGRIPQYPGGNILITGNLKKRCSLVFDLMNRLTKSDYFYTVIKSGRRSETPLFSLLFWMDKILFIPRKKEVSYFKDSMVGGLELSGHFLIAAPIAPHNTFEGMNREKLIDIIKDVTFSQEDMYRL
ncbi:hypothetical protein acsn021_15600 [Anaerocolumna cellulosilytica]|uniref:Uncharacterized protein n=1 Tax=Anaerocolumna cellulosilytica TaxID=433286 RepID=A0A6S6R4F6_9FIRM|nr:hypothetical protein [Anaerocolumna cellulosilytica]MBB5196729.1 hypothetical protein [Anaerocolumna cellulosilytica]BCJ93991.1 hypothetical protein acsn021_15600 [Anaerocolumna cellulosilytica]